MAADEETGMDPMKVAIGCHNFLLGEGLQIILAEEDAVKVIAVFTEGGDFEKIRKASPDLLVVDLAVFRELADPFQSGITPKILLLTGRNFNSTTWEQIRGYIDHGLVGLLPFFTTSDLFRKAIAAIGRGELWFDRKSMSELAVRGSNSKNKDLQLTRTEREVVFLLCQGFRNKEIAQKLDITEQTVKSHCNRIFRKTGVTDRLQLVVEINRHFPELAQGNNHPPKT